MPRKPHLPFGLLVVLIIIGGTMFIVRQASTVASPIVKKEAREAPGQSAEASRMKSGKSKDRPPTPGYSALAEVLGDDTKVTADHMYSHLMEGNVLVKYPNGTQTRADRMYLSQKGEVVIEGATITDGDSFRITKAEEIRIRFKGPGKVKQTTSRIPMGDSGK